MLILAHRGLPGASCPEGSVAAVAAALAAGADGGEVDLRLTADGVLAVSHDPTLGRLTGVFLDVATSTWAELAATAEQRGVRLARAEQLLALSAGHRLVLEVKRPRADRVEATAAAVAALVGGGTTDVRVSSFDPVLLAAVRARRAGVRTALLGDVGDCAVGLVRRALDAGHDEVHPHVLPLLAQPAAVAAAHGCGVAVVPWTVNRRRDLRRLERLGVDGVITDVPAAARAVRSPSAA